MSSYTAGERLTAALLAANPVAETSTTGLSAATGFSTVTFSGRRVNGITTVFVTLTRTGSSIAEGGSNNGNIADTSLCTLPSGWRPSETINAMWGNGQNDGECTISTSGVISLRSTSGATGLANGTNVAVTSSWISG